MFLRRLLGMCKYSRLMKLLGTQQEGVARPQEIVDEELELINELLSPAPQANKEINAINSLMPSFSFVEEKPVVAIAVDDEELLAQQIREMNAFRLS